VWGLNSRLRSTSRIRVGPSAQGYPFPAPTGIVDYSLKVPGAERSASALASTDGWGGKGIEADFVLPLATGRSSLGLGFATFEEEYYNGSSGQYANVGANLRWTPVERLEVQGFGVISEGSDDETGPIYVPAGSFLPPRVSRRRFEGPDWADYQGTAFNYGVVARYVVSPRWSLRLGAFHSAFDEDHTYSHLLTGLQQDGAAQRLIVADPPSKLAASSGELRATRSFGHGEFLHQLHFNVRSRRREHRYDGSDTIDLGPRVPGVTVDAPEPVFDFGPQTRDHIEQETFGTAYELRWGHRAEFGAGLQRSDYEKRVELPDARTETEDDPWLYNLSGAYAISRIVTLYASYTRGLEESGVAPDAAVNRKEALPAIRTRQADAGLSIALGSSMKLLAGVFDVTKPYFSLDAQGRYTSLGDVMHRGVELSLTGSVAEQLDIVAGAVLLDPEVTGPEVDSGGVGSRPVGQPDRTLQLNLDWKPPWLPDTSLDLQVTHTSDTPATGDNRVELPARTLLDVGGRRSWGKSRGACS
jgi:iron complex outermembrane receptor protein